ncbi:hypothetical protein C8R44DRAFT_873501 [Mycena epipterygia]|nr:hypothetical protein C8R44DRAFT_873501 [Mycena epipterygia]
MAPQHRVRPITLEEKREKIPLSSNRNEMLPDLYWATNHPQLPKPNRCLLFEIDLSPEKMKALFEWENEQEVANFATDVELEAQGSFGMPNDIGPVCIFSRGIGSQNAWDDACQGWFIPSESFPQELKTNLKTAVEKAMGPSELITLEPPVCNTDGTWKGGLAFEHGAKPVKPDTRCYTLANSYQAPKETWSPAANAKINGTFNANNLLYQELIVAAAGFGKFATEQAPPDVYEDMKNHAAMLNIPALGCEGNFAYQTLQANLAPTAKFGSNDGLSKSIGTFGKMHRDTHDSAGRYTNMTMCSLRVPKNYILGKFYVPRLGIHFTLRNFDSLNFCGLNIHGGSPPVAPEGTEVANDAYRVTLIAYPPAAMGDGLGHIAVAALPGPKNPVLKMTAEMQNLDCESRRNRAFSTRSNFAQDGQVTNDPRSHVTFMSRLFLLLIIFLSNQLPFFYKFRIDSDRFLGSFSFEVGGVRESVGSWDNGPGFRDPNATYEPSDGNNLVSQDTIRSHHKRLWRLHYNRLSRHIPYAVVHGMAYDIDAHGNLLEDMEVDDDLGTDALGNPIEKGGRPWKKPAAPVSQAKAARQEALKRATKAAAALKATADGSPNGSGNHRSKRKKKTANIDLAKTDTLGAIWTSEPYTTLQKDFLSANPRPGQLEGAEMNPADMNPMNVVRNLDDVDDFMEVTIDQQELDQEIKFLRRLNYDDIYVDYLAVFEASQHLSEVTPSYSPPHLELAFAGMRKDPIAIETCVHISQAWGEIKDLYIYEAEATLVLKLDRHSIMQTTYTFWTWLDGYCVQIIKNALEDTADCIIQNAMNDTIVSINWIARLTRHVRMLLESRGPARELRSSDFGAAELHGKYIFQSRRSLDPTISHQKITTLVIDIIAQWLNFPVEDDSRAKAWFVQAMFRDCHPSTLYLDSVWYAFCHLDVEIFGQWKGTTVPSPATYTTLSTALHRCVLSKHSSREWLMVARIDEILTSYRNTIIAAQTRTTSTNATQPFPLPDRSALVVDLNIPSPQLLLTPADDASQLRHMNRFLDYLLELLPLIDGTTIARPTLLQAAVSDKPDFLLPFREHGPSRIHSRGPTRAFDPTHAATKAGLFSGLVFRAVTFASPFGLQSTITFFRDPADWNMACANFPAPPANFFCNPWAYSKRKSKRDTSLVDLHWNALNTPGCPDWEHHTAKLNYAFLDCYEFLSGGTPTRFKEVGKLAGFLLAADFVYAGVVVPPTVDEVGRIIRDLNKGGVRALELMHLITPREKGTGRAWKMANISEVRTKFTQLYNFLDTRLTDSQKLKMIFDAIMVENGLCKFTRVTNFLPP